MNNPVKLFLLTAICAFCTQAGATDYYVDQGNSSASDSNSGTATSPWKTISKANSTLVAGDRVFIKAGVYSSHVEPASSGTASQPITYLNFGTDVVTISNSILGVQLINKNYITVKGINCVYCDTFLNLEGSSHNVIDHCTFIQMRNLRLWQGSRLYWNSQYNWIHDSTFAKYGSHGTTDTGSVFAIGEEENQTDNSYYNRIENNTFYHGGHDIMSLDAKYTVIRGNTFHNENWQNGHGERDAITSGYSTESGWNLIEGNKFTYSGYPALSSEYGSPGLCIANRENIIRGNYFYHNNENGLMLSHTANYMDVPSNNRIYNNTFFHNGFNTSPNENHEALCGLGFALWTVSGTETISGNIVKNNLFWKNAKAWDSYGNLLGAQTFAGNWAEAGDPLFVNASTTLGDPFNLTSPDLSIRTNSPCVNAGVFLAKVTSASGSGKTFQVDEPGYFMDGWGIVPGDLIQFQGSTQRARIVSINSTTKTITVDTALTWTQNLGLSLAYEGSAPDIGAFEVGSGTASTKPNPPPNFRIVSTSP